MILADYKHLRCVRQRLEESSTYVVTTNGFFDLLTVGHIFFFREVREVACREAEDWAHRLMLPIEQQAPIAAVIVGIDQDANALAPHVVERGKKPPIFSLKDRLRIVNALEPVTYVVPLVESPPDEFLRAARPHMHCKGTDAEGEWQPEDLPEAALLHELGAEVRGIPNRLDSSTGAKFRATRSCIPDELWEIVESLGGAESTEAFAVACQQIAQVYAAREG